MIRVLTLLAACLAMLSSVEAGARLCPHALGLSPAHAAMDHGEMGHGGQHDAHRASQASNETGCDDDCDGGAGCEGCFVASATVTPLFADMSGAPSASETWLEPSRLVERLVAYEPPPPRT